MRLRSILLVLAGVLYWAALPAPAWSQPIQGFYIDVGAGLRMPFGTKASSLERGVPGTFDLRQSLGYDTMLSGGYALGNGWRFELEGNFGRSSIHSASGTAFPAISGGAVENRGVMVNALFDLDIRSPYVFPYLGLGVGYQSTRLDSFVDTRLGKPGAFSASGTQGGFATQVIGGLSFPIPYMPGLSLTVDYRVMDILGGEKFQGTSSIGLAAGSAPVAGSVKLHNQFDQTVMFGVRYAFNTPPPAGVDTGAAPAPRAELQSYEVAFDPNKAALSERARAIVRDAAAASTRQGTTRIAVTGASGDASDRQALSGRRANIVVAALVASGVPKDAIAVRPAERDEDDRWVEIVTR